ncbi:hypothetical protein J6590_052675 [Homalodisca vitripennis]|nr:hypothetical protein J6590_052675 [Homalodisca vitripennis]
MKLNYGWEELTLAQAYMTNKWGPQFKPIMGVAAHSFMLTLSHKKERIVIKLKYDRLELTLAHAHITDTGGTTI